MIKETIVDLVKVDYLCDKCGAALAAGGSLNMTMPPSYSYECPRCHEKYDLPEFYPHTKVVPRFL